ncbi:MAG: UDP-2,3-diacylglucosamine diphosphatase, partial [Ketobacteraceae bacterium]|nr:UDP-2,3-diacylglucosamine diphosphatase [Ketobacteraceae bacterium]
TAGKQEYITDVSPDEVIKAMEAHRCPRMIHGHTHRPACHPLTLKNDQGNKVSAERMVLGDWGKTGWYIQADENGVNLEEFFPG